MKLIDSERKGNVLRLYFGRNKEMNWHGDDWNDAPYQYNAERVFDEYIREVIDIAIPFDDLVWEPSDDCKCQSISKDDMKKRKMPCNVLLPEGAYGGWGSQ